MSRRSNPFNRVIRNGVGAGVGWAGALGARKLSNLATRGGGPIDFLAGESAAGLLEVVIGMGYTLVGHFMLPQKFQFVTDFMAVGAGTLGVKRVVDDQAAGSFADMSTGVVGVRSNPMRRYPRTMRRRNLNAATSDAASPHGLSAATEDAASPHGLSGADEGNYRSTY